MTTFGWQKIICICKGEKMKKSVLIVENDAEQLIQLKKLAKAAGENINIYLADNSAMAYQFLLEKTIDVFLVDVVLDSAKPGDISGIRLAERLKEIPKYMFTPVFLITSLADPAMYAYTKLNCISIIKKPFDPLKIVKRVKTALNYTTVREKEVSLFFRKDNILYPVKMKEIVYMESLQQSMYIHIINSPVLEATRKSCKYVLQEEDISNSLLQCSKGTLVNKEYILEIDAAYKFLTLKDGLGRLYISDRYKKSLLAEFRNF